MTVSNPSPNNQYSVEKFEETDNTTAGPQVPVVDVLDPIELKEQYQRIDAKRFMR